MLDTFAQILQRECNLDPAVYEQAVVAVAEKGGSLADALVRKGVISERKWLKALSRLYGLPVWPDLAYDNLDVTFARKVPIQFLKRFVMVPLAMPAADPADAGNGPAGAATCWIAVNDPAGVQAAEDLARVLGLEDYRVALAGREAILSAINLAYDMSLDSAEQLVQDMEVGEGITLSDDEGTMDLLDDTSEAPIIKLVNHTLSQAIKARASDIHIEPYQDSFKIRYRVDGILYDLIKPPKWVQASLISRVKVMAKLNIAEKRLPQDGRFDVKIGDRAIDVRVSTVPTSFGERVVMRLLDKSGSLLTMTDLGFAPDHLAMMEELVRLPNGIILVTGPTGSGKTTTLYAVLSSINSPDINIITIEDPIEYKLAGISQIQVNPKIDLTFARGLRSIVRQDPDVILVGEIRDRETAEIAVQSALTGHLVFSTLHTNDSAGAVTRLVELGVEPFLISSAVLAVMAQRLVRVLCIDCKQPHLPDDVLASRLGLTRQQLHQGTVFKAVGCDKCFHTGHRGRLGIFEILRLSAHLKTLILKTHDSNQIKDAALAEGMVTLAQDGTVKALQGLTTLEEVLRVTHR